jgi:hypothetical protein
MANLKRILGSSLPAKGKNSTRDWVDISVLMILFKAMEMEAKNFL